MESNPPITPNQKHPIISNVILLNTDGTPSKPNGGETASLTDGATMPTAGQSDTQLSEVVSQNYVFVPFADGGLFRYRENPNKPGTWVLVDSRSLPVAVTGEKAMADFLCRAAHCLVSFLQAQQEKSGNSKSIEGEIV